MSDLEILLWMGAIGFLAFFVAIIIYSIYKMIRAMTHFKRGAHD